MSARHGFASALLNRERNRILLAEALDSQYAADRRGRFITRLVIGTILLGAGVQITKGMKVLDGLLRPVERRHEILAQVKKQIAEGDPAVVGGAPRAVESPAGGGGRFAREQVPLNLFGDLNRHGPGPAPGYASREYREGGELLARREKRVPFECARYSPATPAQLARLPHPSSPPHLAAYDTVAAVPARFAADAGEFPVIPGK